MSDGSFYQLNIIDTSGDIKYISLSTNFIKKSNVIIIIYDITNKNSFNELSFLNEAIKNNFNKNQKVIL